MRRLTPLLCCVLVLASSTIACSAESGVRATDARSNGATPGTAPAGDPIDWTPLPDDPHVETGTLTVPYDYDDPSLGTFELNLARHLANSSDRIGSLLVNPGGPGAAGVGFAYYAEANFGKSLVDHFDIVAWDPRGAGGSTPAIDCTDDYDHFFVDGDITPDTAAERTQMVDLAKEFTNDCVTKNSPYYQYVGTNNSARDMDAIRKALGEDTISYLGFSYGSELGATWATLFPSTVRAAVLDGAVDPTVSEEQANVEQMGGFEHSLDTFLAQCSADSKCRFHNDGNAEGAFDALMQSIDDSPIPSNASGRPPVTRKAALTAVADALYDDARWPDLADALAKAQKGDGSGLLAFFDDYYERQDDGSYDNTIEAFQVISCADNPQRDTVAQSDATVAEVHKVAPRMGAQTVGDYFCTFFPKAIDPRVAITAKGAPPIVVLGTTGDPATPLEGARKMAESLEHGRFVTVVGNQHTGYGVNECSRRAVEDYLIDPVGHLPAEGLRCG